MNNILYVEDDLSLIDGLKYTLETSGYMIDISRTVKEALTLFKQSQYDLLLFLFLITDKWGIDWSIPASSLLLIVLLCFISAAIAIGRPIKQISKMAIVDTVKVQQ